MSVSLPSIAFNAVAVVMLRLKNLFEQLGIPRQDLGMVILRRGNCRHGGGALRPAQQATAASSNVERSRAIGMGPLKIITDLP